MGSVFERNGYHYIYYVGKMVKGPAITGCAGTNASISLGVPTSNIDVCAFFHCHTTLHYCPKTTSRRTGPSQNDLDLAQSYNLPGILRDYEGPEISMAELTADEKNSISHRFHALEHLSAKLTGEE